MPALRETCRVTPGGLRRYDSSLPPWPNIDPAMSLRLENEFPEIGYICLSNFFSVSTVVEGNMRLQFLHMFGLYDH